MSEDECTLRWENTVEEKGSLRISPFAMAFDIPKILGVSGLGATDPWNVKHVEIQYENINNTGYVMGCEIEKT